MDIKKQTVLIVDDMPSNIEILEGVLGTDYEVLFATSGKDALEIASAQNPDLILLDIVIPDMDGYEVCARLKSNPKTQDIPVIFVTAKDQEEDESKGLNAGVIDYITKPIRPAIVKARVHNHLELKRYRDSLKTLSMMDGLTGIPNRRQFDEALENEWRRARRNQTSLALLMMDIDFFKAFNDHYGHLAGDDCLRQLARSLAEVIRRPADLVARYGGEEFVALLPETNAAGALEAAGRIQEKIKMMNMPHAFSSVADRVTLSIGVAATVPTDKQMPIELIKHADDCLYAAKQSGRNTIKSNVS